MRRCDRCGKAGRLTDTPARLLTDGWEDDLVPLDLVRGKESLALCDDCYRETVGTEAPPEG